MLDYGYSNIFLKTAYFFIRIVISFATETKNIDLALIKEWVK